MSATLAASWKVPQMPMGLARIRAPLDWLSRLAAARIRNAAWPWPRSVEATAASAWRMVEPTSNGRHHECVHGSEWLRPWYQDAYATAADSASYPPSATSVRASDRASSESSVGWP